MLAVSDDAARLVEEILSRSELGEEAGVRLSVEGPVASLAMGVEPYPREADVVIPAGGARVFLSPRAAARTETKRLEAELSHPAFYLRDRDEGRRAGLRGVGVLRAGMRRR